MLHPQPRVIEDLAQELLDVRHVDPGGAEPGVDRSRRQVGRDDPAQFGDVDREPRIVLGGSFVFRALRLWREPSEARAWGLFKFSVLYLGALFAAVAIDALV